MKTLTYTSYINAYTLFVAAKRLGVELDTVAASPLFPIPSACNTQTYEWLLFTEEASLRKALHGEISGKFWPNTFPLQLLDDKWAFAEWLQDKDGLTPSLAHCSLEDEASIPFPFLIKAKHSWLDANKLPRGWICHSLSDVVRYRAKMVKQGWSPEYFYIQEWLGDADCSVISVCGFYDAGNASRNLACVVERFASYHKGLSCSSVVGVIDDVWDLTSKTFAILTALAFTGPYELEFLVTGDRVLVLELNPRFWMQHVLFLADGNGLLKRYFGLDTLDDHRQKTLRKLLWIDGLFLVNDFVTLRFSVIPLLIDKYREGYELLVWPTIPLACWVWMKIVYYRVRKIIKYVTWG